MSANRTFVSVVSGLIVLSIVLLASYTASSANIFLVVVPRSTTIAAARPLTLIVDFFVISHVAVKVVDLLKSSWSWVHRNPVPQNLYTC